MSNSFDAIVIGAGQAGPSLAVRLAASGLKTALIEREHLGGAPASTMAASPPRRWSRVPARRMWHGMPPSSA